MLTTLLSGLLILQALPIPPGRISPHPLLRRDKDARTVEAVILRLEDERDFNPAEFERFLSLRHVGIRRRAALAIGRIGDKRGVPLLADVLVNDGQPSVRAMAAFGLGEIEDAKAASMLLERVGLLNENLETRARAAEALGKIVSAEGNRELLGLQAVHAIALRLAGMLPEPERKLTDKERLATSLVITALMRVRDEMTVPALVRQLSSTASDMRWQAANALLRMRFPIEGAANTLLGGLDDREPLVRASFARALAATGDPARRDGLPAIVKLLDDPDPRVVVSAVRALATLKQPESVEALIRMGSGLVEKIARAPQEERLAQPEINVLEETATALGQLGDPKAVPLLKQMRLLSGQLGSIPEVETSIAKFGEEAFFDLPEQYAFGGTDWRGIANFAQGLGILRTPRAGKLVLDLLGGQAGIRVDVRSVPALLEALAATNAPGTAEVLRLYLQSDDVSVRATAAQLIAGAGLPEAEKWLTVAYQRAKQDKSNDARIAILTALSHLTPKSGSDVSAGLTDPDFVVRLQTARLLARMGLGDYSASVGKVNLGRKASYYERVRDRSNDNPVVVLDTAKGRIEIELFARDATLTTENFLTLAKAGFFNGLTFHRVVMNFVAQGGDPRGDGNGGPGYQIRCEINARPYVRGSVGMALSGKDTGGSQFFICHSPQPHLDGGYTVFGQVISGMEIVDRLTRGDRIRQVTIRE